MKLLNYTTGIFSGILFLLLSLWALLFYFEMLDEIYDSLDDGLENHKMQVIQRTQQDSLPLDKTTFEDGFQITKVTKADVFGFTDTYRDTLMYMQNEKDYEPARLLISVFEQNGDYYRLKVVTSMVEEDDLVKELFFSLLWLYFGLILSIILLNNMLHRKIWRPFYKLISRLGSFSLEKGTEIKTEPTKIMEFRLLNEQVEKLLNRSVETFNDQKQFIENTSHELQTPLAISINRLELLVEKNDLSETQILEIAGVLENLERLTRFNKSLLLLSKIENQQFPEAEVVNFNALVRQSATEFEDLAKHRSMHIEIQENVILEHRMNKDLALILVSNLLKNALLHGKKGTEVRVEFLQGRLQISNKGSEQALNPNTVFNRFNRATNNKKSNGLGLAISKAIADRFGLRLTYAFTGNHNFNLHFRRQEKTKN